MAKKKRQNESIVYSILRMSQKALLFVLILIGLGYIGSIIAIIADPTLADPLSNFSQVFIPLFQLEIGVYGLGSTVENVQKIRKKIDDFNKKEDSNEGESNENESFEQNG